MVALTDFYPSETYVHARRPSLSSTISLVGCLPPINCFSLIGHLSTVNHLAPKIFKDATLFFSRDTPNLAMVIPAMDHIDMYLTNCTRAGNNLSPSISSALRLAKKTLNRYYKLSDMSATYRIAMGKQYIINLARRCL